MIKLLLEFGPIVVFFITYKYSDILLATKLMICVTSVCLAISYWVDKKVSIPLLLSAVVLMISGIITIATGDSKYIKMKPTIVYLIFSGALYIFARREVPLIKNLLGQVIEMKNENWIVLSKRFAVYFVGMAIINEIIWRNFSDNFWVNFKVFGALPITLAFLALQLPFIIQNQITSK